MYFNLIEDGIKFGIQTDDGDGGWVGIENSHDDFWFEFQEIDSGKINTQIVSAEFSNESLQEELSRPIYKKVLERARKLAALK